MTQQIQKTHDDYTVGILCALDFEADAVRYMMDAEHVSLRMQPGDSNMYTLGELRGHNAVLACMPYQQGKGSAATVATDMSRSFPSIKWRLFVGIGGGVPSDDNDIRLGDVVISTPEDTFGGVIQYDLGRRTVSGFELKGFLTPPPPLLRQAARQMKSDHRGRSSMIEQSVNALVNKEGDFSDFAKPSEPDTLFEEDYEHLPSAATCARCDRSRTIQRAVRRSTVPMIHYGLIASGDQVIKTAKLRDEINATYGREVLCFEMEAAGLMTNFSAIVIRGISDYADSHKNKKWQGYAAATAAACAKELLSYIDPEDAATMPGPEALSSPPPAQPSELAPGSNYFYGQGIQSTGSGNVNIGGGFNTGGRR
ncbi:nucleoside phosphorylase domain-containing protein [Nemania sp. FL0916]|nr:nucleoside phosphorylase domain-containing protein [Nemania sp. FL0916]